MAKELRQSPVVPSARLPPRQPGKQVCLRLPVITALFPETDTHTGIPLNTRLFQQRRGNSMPGGRISNGKINSDGKREQNTKPLVMKVG